MRDSKESETALIVAELLLPKASHHAKSFIEALFQSAREGHLALFLKKGDPLWQGVAELPPSIFDKLIVQKGSLFYLKRYFEAENTFLAHLERLKNEEPDLKVPQDVLEAALEKVTLNKDQKLAFVKACQKSLSLISGGPGTGKSTFAKELICFFKNTFPEARIAVTAPTGKAVSNLSKIDVEGIDFKTLHAALRNQPYLYDLFLVDEASMIDAELFAALLSSIRKGSRLVLLGDPFQLPPIEAGALFYDISRLESEHGVELKQTYRAENSEILDTANAIIEGRLPAFEPMPSQECLLDMIVRNPEKRKVLTPLMEGPFGAERLNALLYNRSGEDIPILITQNDWDLGLANGDQGILNRMTGFATIKGTGYPQSLLPSFAPAFVLSIHKSQGSEYEEVFVLIPKGSERFGRELLYTAVTRAKKRVRIFAESKVTLETILSKKMRRISGLWFEGDRFVDVPNK